MKIINTDLQARAVLQLVTATALFFAGLLIFGYRLLEPTQQLLYHSISSSFQVMMIAFGGSVLLRCYRRERKSYRWLSSALACVAILAVVDGLIGSLFDRFDAQIPTLVYLAFLPMAISLVPVFSGTEQRKQWQQEFIKLNAAYALGLAAFSVAFLMLHLFLKSPLLAKHPTGSLVICVTGILAGVAVYSTHYRGRRPLPRLSSSSSNFASLAIFLVLVFGVGMFHTEMSDLKAEGDRSIKQLRDSRAAIGETTVKLFERLAERWQLYPYNVHSRLMEVDLNAYLQHIDFLEALLLVSPDEQVVFERLKPSRSSYLEEVMSDPVVLNALAEEDQTTDILLPLFATEDLSAKIIVRVPVDFVEEEGVEDSGVYRLLAVLDARAMLDSAMMNTLDTDIETYDEVLPGMWMDRSGFWVSPVTRNYLEDTAILLDTSNVNLYHTQDVPVMAYLYQLDNLQETSNLQMLIVVGGIGLVLLVVLAVERNVTLEVQGKQLFYQARHDGLTGLMNRSSIEEYIGKHFHESQDVTVLFIDLDGFTLINDSLGLHIGDAILMQLAERLQEQQPRRSELARFASDEFIMVLHGAVNFPDRVSSLAQEIMTTVAQPYRIEEHKIYLTASVGVAHQTGDVRTPLELIQRADMAMHQAKRYGYNHVQEYDKSMAQRLLSTTSMRSNLQEAIENNELQLHYQPIVRCNDQRAVQVEALLRWQQEDGSYIPPSEFIPLAEMTGQIVPLSEWVFRRACEDAVRLQQRERSLRMSVNVSALHFNRANFVDFVLHTLAETGCRANWLELELTESILLEGTQYAIQRLDELRKHGLTIALDDFGTGFSSLSYLKRLPIDTVKIDRSFIAGIRHHKSDRVLIDSVIKIAQSLDFAVLAEGIETPQQAEFVTDLGCNYMQGYYFGRPIPLENL
ncbi:putative bifunctional diguanylate cyclase/phosphodiesterase [Pseudidiomarina terrestris]|uniref:putative bifunctional diguanylate cyclase/phosphodiesterase n=1 Tax=Pseudidiomarina terrestris TaxID=2820060 RepID=UPI00265517A6|nr:MULTISPECIES: bifunctional diguanylate cyclase/phosphodiesterase [unclassified Pseudidiomarina]MDN7134606.1 bifunctional diguanylate cyclase/phosphodiesterase [Pseudidiomarina sp. 1ASP75-5]MDN7136724.1 bifunctional diguanylate cyclase/phosphodiesterase [Pseudidiomarina sp. 1ASP75-14]